MGFNSGFKGLNQIPLLSPHLEFPPFPTPNSST